MERITGRVGYALAYVGESRKDPKGDVPGEMSTQAVMDVLGRLEQYENTGLEPGEIAAWIRNAKRRAETVPVAIAEIGGILNAIANSDVLSENLKKLAGNASRSLIDTAMVSVKRRNEEDAPEMTADEFIEGFLRGDYD